MDGAYTEINRAGIGETADARKTVSRMLGSVTYYGTLLAVLVFAIPYGTAEPWHKGVFVGAIATLGVLRVLDGLLRSAFRIAETILLLPVIGILLLAAVQVAPMPFVGEPLSRDPYETKAFMLVFGALIVFGEILFAYTSGARQLKQLVGLVLAVAIASSIFGFLRDLMGFDLQAGNIHAEQSYAQFINRNHFAMLIEMGLGLLIGLLLKADLSGKMRFVGWMAVGVLIYSMIVANSRGGLISLAGMAVFATFFHVMTLSRSSKHERQGPSPRQRRRPKLMWKIATASGLCVLVVGMIVVLIAFVGGDTVVKRIEKLDREMTASDSGGNRAAIWTSTVEMIKEHPVFGSGLGAFKTAFTEFDKSNGGYSVEQAHNDYLEIAANGGLVAGALFAIFGGVVGTRMVRVMSTGERFRQACGFGAMIGIFGVLVHSFVDFGLHIIVNSMIFIVLIVIGTVQTKVPVGEHGDSIRSN